MTSKTLQLETLTCPSCMHKIENAVKSLSGVSAVQVMFNSSKVKVAFDEQTIDTAKIRNTIEILGFDVLSEK